jgi:hypothetical protein
MTAYSIKLTEGKFQRKGEKNEIKTLINKIRSKNKKVKFAICVDSIKDMIHQ